MGDYCKIKAQLAKNAPNQTNYGTYVNQNISSRSKDAAYVVYDGELVVNDGELVVNDGAPYCKRWGQSCERWGQS